MHIVCSNCPVAAAAVTNPALSPFKCCIPNMTSVSVMSTPMEDSGCLVPLQKCFISWHPLSMQDREVSAQLQLHATGQSSECISPSRAMSPDS